MKAAVLLLASLVSGGLMHAQIGEPEGASRRSGWESIRSQLRPDKVPAITQDFGWSATHHAGGDSSGEIGGRIQRALKRCRYAMPLAETLTLKQEIMARGRFAVTHDEGSSGALVGFFHESSEGWRTPNSIAFRVDGNGGNYWLFFEYGTRNGKTGGKGVFEGERYQTTQTKPFAADGSAHSWQLHYDPKAGEHGILHFQVDGNDYAIELTKEARQDGAQFNRFGLWNQQTTGNGLEMWIDDLVVQGRPVSFDDDPKWISENNRGSFHPAAVRPFHDYGFRADEEWIGGVIWRDEAPSYCAQPVGRLTLEQPLKAAGRIRLNQAAADSGLYIGWFDCETKRGNKHPEHKRRQRNYLALHVEGPSRVGHYARPGYGTRTGRGRNAESGPVLLPDNEWHSWSIDYQPDKRLITATLDEASVSLSLDKEDLRDGAVFDRFGVFNHQSGGWHLDFEIDQLEFTGKPFALIVLPDTQGYADIRHEETQKHWPDIGDQRACFFRQTEWIKDNRRKRNLKLVVHVGDITQTDHEEEWKIADTAFKTIDPHVPYILCSGNHDMGYASDLRKTGQSRASLFSTFFPPSRFIENPLYGAHFAQEKQDHFRESRKTENYYLFFQAAGMKFLVIALEFKPTDEALAWANAVATQHADRRIIVVTHAYLTKEGKRTQSDGYPIEGNSGQAVWDTFVSHHQNIFLVLSGHAGESQLTSTGRHGNAVHQIQSDYWYWDLPRIKAGSGFLRILTFHPSQNRIDVETYSPVLDEFLDRPSSKFSLPFAMAGE